MKQYYISKSGWFKLTDCGYGVQKCSKKEEGAKRIVLRVKVKNGSTFPVPFGDGALFDKARDKLVYNL